MENSIYQKKILIIGANGYIGGNFVNFLESKQIKTFGVDLNLKTSSCFFEADITKRESILSVLGKTKPDIIIHTAAISSLSACQKNPELADNVNFCGTKNLVDCINQFNSNALLFFMSSDYVFEGSSGNYKESDPTEPKTIYGTTKLKAENYIKSYSKKYIVCRTANIFGRGGNFFDFILENLSKNIPTDVFYNTSYTPTYIDYFLECVLELLKQDYTGIIHIAGKEKISRYEFAKLISKLSNHNSDLIRKTKQPVDGLISKDSSLDTEKLNKISKIPCPTLENSINCSLANNTNTSFKTKSFLLPQC